MVHPVLSPEDHSFAYDKPKTSSLDVVRNLGHAPFSIIVPITRIRELSAQPPPSGDVIFPVDACAIGKSIISHRKSGICYKDVGCCTLHPLFPLLIAH